jgi:hypothetical protein
MPSRFQKVLSAVSATGPSPVVTASGAPAVALFVRAAAVTTGFTIDLEGSPDGSNWFQLTTRTISANGNFVDTSTTPVLYVRANVTARTDGTVDAWLSVAHLRDTTYLI